jgi:ubiquinone/menaquinone biosynthesis C-methylase UbiE
MGRNNIPIQDYKIIVKVIGDNVTPNISDAIINSLNITQDSNIIELGCGTGGNAKYISSKTGASVFGVDNNEYVIEQASKIIPVIKFDLAYKQYPIISNSVDGVYFLNLLQLIENKDQFFNEIFRILKPQGRLFMLITTKNQIEERYINRYFPSLVSIEFDRHLSEVNIVTILNQSGFSIIDQYEIISDYCIINNEYLDRLKSGILSSLLILDESERVDGLKNLEIDIQQFKLNSDYPKYMRIKKALVAQKLQP